jgi:hypothetical protein
MVARSSWTGVSAVFCYVSILLKGLAVPSEWWPPKLVGAYSSSTFQPMSLKSSAAYRPKYRVTPTVTWYSRSLRDTETGSCFLCRSNTAQHPPVADTGWRNRSLLGPKFYSFTRPDPGSIWPEPKVHVQVRYLYPIQARLRFIPARICSLPWLSHH